MPSVTINGSSCEAEAGEWLIDVINRIGKEVPQVCYHPQLGPIQTCDTCMVEVNGKLIRACGTAVAGGMTVLTESPIAKQAQREAFDRILGNHLCIAPFAITIMETVRFTIPQHC
jgi:formate dehydrogenase major subunit